MDRGCEREASEPRRSRPATDRRGRASRTNLRGVDERRVETDLASPAAGASTNALKRQVQARELVQNLGRHPAPGARLPHRAPHRRGRGRGRRPGRRHSRSVIRAAQPGAPGRDVAHRATDRGRNACGYPLCAAARPWLGPCAPAFERRRPAFFTGLLVTSSGCCVPHPVWRPAARYRRKRGTRLDEAASNGARRAHATSGANRCRSHRRGRFQLAAPTGQLAVLGVIDGPRLDAISGLVAAPDPALQSDWLPVVAAVRPSLARLEAWLLEQEIGGATSLASWSRRRATTGSQPFCRRTHP